VLCSDGVTDFVPDSDILEALLEGNFDVMQLVNKALAAGGLDNIFRTLRQLFIPTKPDTQRIPGCRLAMAAMV
jgi:serine/threonine protein phosphatase PrpC